VRASVAFGSATYLREEPDALRSARPGLSGGYYASGIPTGFDSFSFVQLSKKRQAVEILFRGDPFSY
jgi:hypothetical protein